LAGSLYYSESYPSSSLGCKSTGRHGEYPAGTGEQFEEEVELMLVLRGSLVVAQLIVIRTL
jgi:hypothetical protein